ncbi:maleylacetoacetate isomerase [Porticoccaceae bacterium LTM1]|nr:maleylacetoacetate isomerase [Porticoccaceae bacterium LTM1]
MKLYGYWRSSAAYRVRIALNLKGVEYEQESVHLVKDGGEQFSDSYTAMNPAQLVPTLVDGELTLNQSMAILDYIENKFSQHPLLPADIAERAQVLALANDIACDIHPLNNLRILKYLTGELGATEEQKTEWYHHWLHKGFGPLEAQAKKYGSTGKFLFGDQLTLADVVLIPQIYNALRFKLDMSNYPLLSSIWEHCNSLDAFKNALPENQPDAS